MPLETSKVRRPEGGSAETPGQTPLAWGFSVDVGGWAGYLVEVSASRQRTVAFASIWSNT